MDSVLSTKSAAYVAGPLDSGRLFYESLVRQGHPDPNIRHINQEHLSRFAQELRQRLPYPVVDPGPLRISGWAGPNYGSFFLQVVERYAKEVWFLDEWEFSTGATKEFVFCMSKRIACLTESGEELTPTAGRLLISNAISFMEKLNLDSSKLRSRLQALDDATSAASSVDCTNQGESSS